MIRNKCVDEKIEEILGGKKEMDYAKVSKKIEDFIKEKTSSLKGGVIGLSGGIDSTAVAYLAVNALGKDKVYGVLMPYGNQSTKDAEMIAKKLGIQYDIINIKPMVEIFEKNAPYFLKDLPKGNLMARIRMCILYGIVNTKGYIVLGTGNKSELEVGYLTKYGDGGVDIEPIGNLYKTEIWELSKHLGVPQKIIEKAPSAELWEKQTDEDEIGMDYYTLDKILQGKTEGIHPELIERVEYLKKNSEHKKRMPPTAEV